MKKRLRRRFHTDEFTELGFVVRATMNGTEDTDRVAAFVNPFIEFLDAHQLFSAGYCSDQNAEFFVQKDGVQPGAFTRHAQGSRASASEEDRGVVEKWLKSQSLLKTFEVGPLEDAWQGG